MSMNLPGRRTTLSSRDPSSRASTARFARWSGKSSGTGLKETKTNFASRASSAAPTSARFPRRSIASIASLRGKQVTVETTTSEPPSAGASVDGAVTSAGASSAPPSASACARGDAGSRTSARTPTPRRPRAAQIRDPSAPVAPATATVANARC